jgi:hypothetical protein
LPWNKNCSERASLRSSLMHDPVLAMVTACFDRMIGVVLPLFQAKDGSADEQFSRQAHSRVTGRIAPQREVP